MVRLSVHREEIFLRKMVSSFSRRPSFYLLLCMHLLTTSGHLVSELGTKIWRSDGNQHLHHCHGICLSVFVVLLDAQSLIQRTWKYLTRELDESQSNLEVFFFFFFLWGGLEE